MQKQTTTHLNTSARRESRSRELERVVSVFCVSIMLSMSLAGVVGYGLARALLATAPSTFRGEVAP